MLSVHYRNSLWQARAASSQCTPLGTPPSLCGEEKSSSLKRWHGHLGASPCPSAEGDTGLPCGHPQKPPWCPVSPAPASLPWHYPKRNFSRYLTGPGFFRGGDGATLGFGGGGFFSGRATVKASSGGCGCQKRGRKCVETCWGRARGLQPRLALPRLLRATYH